MFEVGDSSLVAPAFLFVHSLLLGPLTWAPVATRLASLGMVTAIPSLVGVTVLEEPPFWPRVVGKVKEAVEQLPPGEPILIVAHSNAGLFVPVIAHAVRPPVAGCLFVDATLPARTGASPATTPERLHQLRSMATDGRLPRWTTWWPEDEVARLFPDPQTRSAVTAEQPRLPLSYYEQKIPVPAGWDDRPCGYLLFGPPYHHLAQEARERGWDVEQVPGEHLHQLVDPDAVAQRIAAMARTWLDRTPRADGRSCR